MKYFYAFLVLSLVFSCTPEKKGNPLRFKYGTFEIPAGNGYSKTTIIRKDSLQIEKYFKKISVSNDSLVSEKNIMRIDTLFIYWKNNFAYRLHIKNPKTKLDKDPIFVQITKVNDTSYNFTSRIGYSNFKIKGSVYKVK